MAEEVLDLAENRIPYWSRFIISADLRWDGVNTFRTLFNSGDTRRVFDYRRGSQSAQALEGAQSTIRDTLLTDANKTRGGAMYEIHGMSLTKDGYAYEVQDAGANQPHTQHRIFPPTAQPVANGGVGPVCPTVEDFRGLDSFMAEVFIKSWTVQVEIDGTTRALEWGPAILSPGQGGASSNVDTTNGSTFVSNYAYFREGIDWNPAGSSDSNFTVLLTAAYTVSVPTFTAPDGTFDGVAIPGAEPSSLGRIWSQGWVCSLHGTEIKPTSDVS